MSAPTAGRSRRWIVAALVVAAAAVGVWFATPGGKTRTLRIGDDLVVELRFQDPVALFVEERGEGDAFRPFAWAVFGPIDGTADMRMSGQPAHDLRVSLGIGGRLCAPDGTVVADSQKLEFRCVHTDQPLRLENAGANAQIQAERGTTLVVDLRDGVLHSTAR